MVAIDLPLALDAQHQAGAHQPAVDGDAARAAVAGRAAFLRAGQSELVAQDIEQRVLRLAQELDRVAVDRCGDMMLCHQAFPCSFERDLRGPAGEHARDLDAIFLGAALVVDGAARGLCGSIELLQSVVVDLGSDQGLGRLGHQQRSRRHRAQRYARCRADALGVERQAHAAADHGNVHLGARNEAQIRIAGMRGFRRQQERGDDLALRQRQLARRQHDVLDRHIAPPLGADDGRLGPGGDQCRHAVGGRRAVAQVAAHGRAALDLCGSDQVGRFHHARPHCLELGMLLELGPRDRRADAEAAGLFFDLTRLGDALDVHQQHRIDHVGPHLHEQVGAPGKHPRLAALPPRAMPQPGRANPAPHNACAMLLTWCRRDFEEKL